MSEFCVCVCECASAMECRATGARCEALAGCSLAAKTANPEAIAMHGGAARSRMASVYWHDALCPNPLLAPCWPDPRGAVDDVLVSKVTRPRKTEPTTSDSRGEGVSRVRVRSPWPYQRQCQCQTRHRKPGRIITDVRQELPVARWPLSAGRRHPSQPQGSLGCCPGSRRERCAMRAGAGVWIAIIRIPKASSSVDRFEMR